jgi:hypothetical protein
VLKFVLPAPSFAPRMASIFKPAATTTLFPVDLLVITPGTLPDGTPCPPDAIMEYKLVDVRRPDGSTTAESEWQPARTDLWPGHTEWCFKLSPGSMKVQVRCVKGPVESPPSPLYAFLVKGASCSGCGVPWACMCWAGWQRWLWSHDATGIGRVAKAGAVLLVCAPGLCG